jgi:hypothetical protein
MRKIEFGDHVQLMQGLYRIAIKHFAIPFRNRVFLSQEYRLNGKILLSTPDTLDESMDMTKLHVSWDKYKTFSSQLYAVLVKICC